MFIIKLTKAAYYEYKIISRDEYVVIYETAIGVDPKSELCKMIKEYAEKKVLEVDKKFSLK